MRSVAILALSASTFAGVLIDPQSQPDFPPQIGDAAFQSFVPIMSLQAQFPQSSYYEYLSGSAQLVAYFGDDPAQHDVISTLAEPWNPPMGPATYAYPIPTVPPVIPPPPGPGPIPEVPEITPWALVSGGLLLLSVARRWGRQ